MTHRFLQKPAVYVPIGDIEEGRAGEQKTAQKKKKKEKDRRRVCGFAMAICTAVFFIVGWSIAIGLQARFGRPCSPNPCLNNGTCTSDFFTGHRTCTCPVGVFGFLCETDTCNPDPCLYGGTCFNGTCTCLPGHSGVFCEVGPTTTAPNTTTTAATTTAPNTTTTATTTAANTTTSPPTTCPDPCTVNPCLNSGTCMADGCALYCNCTIYFTGAICEIPVATTMSGVILDESGSHLRIDVNHATVINPNYTYYQLFTLFRPNDTSTYYASETPSPTSIPVYAALTSVTFPIGPANGDIVTSYLYDGPDVNTATLISSVSLQYRTVPSILIGYDTQLAWNGTDYAYYPLQIGGLNGTVVENMTAYMDYARSAYYFPYPATDPTTGLLHGLSTVINLSIPSPERVGRPDKYFIYTVVMTGLTIVHDPLYSASTWNYVAPLIFNDANVVLGSTDHNTDADWGDGSPIQVFGSGFSDTFGSNFLNYMGSSIAHNYASPGTYTIRLAGRSRYFSERSWVRIVGSLATPGSRISNVLQWGDYVSDALDFADCPYFAAPPTATDFPNPTITNIARLFDGAPTWSIDIAAGWTFPGATDARGAFAGRVIASTVANLFPGAPLQKLNAIFSDCSFSFSGPVGVETWVLNGLTDGGIFFRSTLSASNFVTFQAGLTQGNVMFAQAVIADFSTVDITIVDQSLLFIVGMFMDCVFALPPDMTALTFPSAIQASNAFSGINNLGAMPNLNMISAFSVADLFAFSSWPTVGPTSTTWTFPSTLNADRMFYGCGGAAFALDSSGWGFAMLDTADSIFEQTSTITTLDVSTWTPTNLQRLNRAWTLSSIVTVDMSGWGVNPFATDEAFIDTSTAVIGTGSIGMGFVESATYMFTRYTGGAINVAPYSVGMLTLATGMFYQYLGGPCVVTAWNVASFTEWADLFRESNCDPNTGSWTAPIGTTDMDNAFTECFITHVNYGRALVLHDFGLYTGLNIINPRQNAILSVGPVSPAAVPQTYPMGPSAAATARANLVSRSWTIVDGGPA